MTLTEFVLARIDDDEAAARGEAPHAPGGRWSPERLLAECEAKRALVELAYEATGLDMTVDLDRDVRARAESGIDFVGERMLLALALPYADHPDFHRDWHP